MNIVFGIPHPLLTTLHGASETNTTTKRGRADAADDVEVDDAGPKRTKVHGADMQLAPAAGSHEPDDTPMEGEEQPGRSHGVTSQADEDHAEAGTSDMNVDHAGGHAAPVRYTDENTVFVKGLRMTIQESELRELFGSCGELQAVRLARDSDGRSRGFAYIEFGSAEALQKAVAMNNTEFQGKILFVAKSDPPGPGGGGRGRGRGRGGGGGGFGRGDMGGRRGGPGLGFTGGRGRDGGGRGGGDSSQGGHRGGREGGTHRQHLQVDDNKPVTSFVPRALAGGAATAAVAPAPSDHPMSNDEFRKMLLSKKA